MDIRFYGRSKYTTETASRSGYGSNTLDLGDPLRQCRRIFRSRIPCSEHHEALRPSDLASPQRSDSLSSRPNRNADFFANRKIAMGGANTTSSTGSSLGGGLAASPPAAGAATGSSYDYDSDEQAKKNWKIAGDTISSAFSTLGKGVASQKPADFSPQPFSVQSTMPPLAPLSFPGANPSIFNVSSGRATPRSAGSSGYKI